MPSQPSTPDMPVASAVSASLDDPAEGFDDLCSVVKEAFTNAAVGPLFTTQPNIDLYESFRSLLPANRQQHYNCRSCRTFFERYGGLVTISPDGTQTPALWDFDDEKFCPPFFHQAVAAIRRIVATASVSGVFLSTERTLGVPQNADAKRGVRWTHLAVEQPRPYKSALKTPNETMAEMRSDFQLVYKILQEYPLTTFQEATKLLRSGNLARPETHLMMAEWFIDLHQKQSAAHGRARRNVLWLAIARAPAGYSHVRAGMLGTLLDDVKAGLPFATIQARWAEKMGPLAYRRTQADPTSGNVEQAEKIVAKLGIQESLRRRFARLDDVLPHALWTPRPPAATPPAAPGSVFGHLKTKDATPQVAVQQPPTVITWEKFRRTVLPDAETIEVLVPGSGPYVALITAVNPEAPPVLQWDDAEKRNPVSWYLRHPTGYARDWNVSPGHYTPLSAIALSPALWGREDQRTNQPRAVDFIIQGCRDTSSGGGGALFTQCLRSELHSVRSVLEAHFKTYDPEGRDEASACGLRVEEGARSNLTLRVHGKLGPMTYQIDRWD